MNAERTIIAVDPETTIIRRARKEHRCTLRCGRIIALGDDYAEYVAGAVGAYAAGPRYCKACALAEGLVLPAPPAGRG